MYMSMLDPCTILEMCYGTLYVIGGILTLFIYIYFYIIYYHYFVYRWKIRGNPEVIF